MKDLPWDYLQPIVYLLIGVVIMVIVGFFAYSGMAKEALLVVSNLGTMIVAAIVNKLRTVKPPEITTMAVPGKE